MEIKHKIKNFIFTNIVKNGQNINMMNTESLIGSGIIDSLAIMKLLKFLEDEFAIQVTNNDLLPENFDSIDALHHLVLSKLEN